MCQLAQCAKSHHVPTCTCSICPSRRIRTTLALDPVSCVLGVRSVVAVFLAAVATVEASNESVCGDANEWASARVGG